MKKSITKAAVATLSVLAAAAVAATPAQAAKKPKKVIVNTVNAAAVAVKGKIKLKVATKPAKANKKVTYKVANKKIAQINKKGVLKGKKAGKTVVTVVSAKNKKAKAKVNVTVVAKKKALKKLKVANKNVVATEQAVASVKVKFNSKKAAAVKAGKIKANNKKLVKVANKKIASVKAVKLNAKKGVVNIQLNANTVGKTKVTYTSLFGKSVKANVEVKTASTGAIVPAKKNVATTGTAVADLYTASTMPATASVTVSGAAAGKDKLIINKKAVSLLTASVASSASIYNKFVNANNKTTAIVGNVTIKFGANAKTGSETKDVTITGAGTAVDGTYTVAGTKINENLYTFKFTGANKMGYFANADTIYLEKAKVDGKDAIIVSAKNGRVFTFSADSVGFTAGSQVFAA